MILRRDTGSARPGGVVAVAQPDHAALAARLAEAWGDTLAPAFRAAVAHHDDVWRERDAAPTWDPGTGLPQDFLALAADDRRAVWERAPERAEPLGPEAELWIVRHAVRLHERADEAGLKALTARLSERGAALVEELRTAHGLRFDDTALARGTSLLALLDALSLRLCLGVEEQVAAGVLTLRPGPDDTVTVAPWPFTDGALDTHLLARRLPGPVSGQAALDVAWADAPLHQEPVRLVPAVSARG